MKKILKTYAPIVIKAIATLIIGLKFLFNPEDVSISFLKILGALLILETITYIIEFMIIRIDQKIESLTNTQEPNH